MQRTHHIASWHAPTCAHTHIGQCPPRPYLFSQQVTKGKKDVSKVTKPIEKVITEQHSALPTHCMHPCVGLPTQQSRTEPLLTESPPRT